MAAVVRLTAGTKSAAYTVAWHGGGWAVTNVAPDDGYRVERGKWACPAGRPGRRCKHRDCIPALVARGLLGG